MGLIQWITQNTLLIVILSALGYLAYILLIRKDKKTEAKEEPKPIEDKKEEPDTTLKRMGRGFNVMKEKLANSDLVKNLQEEQKTASEGKIESMMPEGLGDKSDNYQWETKL